MVGSKFGEYPGSHSKWQREAGEGGWVRGGLMAGTGVGNRVSNEHYLLLI